MKRSAWKSQETVYWARYMSKNDEKISLEIARNCILGKVYNARWVLERAVRDHSMQIDAEGIIRCRLMQNG